MSSEAPTEQRLERMRKEAEAAQQAATNASGKAGDVRGVVKAMRRTIEERMKALSESLRAENLSENVLSALESVHIPETPEESADALETAVNVPLDAVERKLSGAAELIRDLERKNERKSELETALSQEEASCGELEAALGEKIQALNTIQGQYQELSRQCAELSASLSYPDTEAAQSALEEMRGQSSGMKAALTDAEEAERRCREEVRELEGQLALLGEQLRRDPERPAIDSELAEIAEKLSAARRKIAELSAALEESETRIRRKEALDLEIPQAEAELETLRGEARRKEERTHEKRREQAALAGQLEPLELLPYESAERVRAAAEAMTAQIKAMREAMEGAETDYRNAEREIHALRAQISQLEARLADSDPAQTERLSAERDELITRREELQNRRQEIHARLDANQSILLRMRRDGRELSALEERLTDVRALSNTANGRLTGKKKIMLETYIQMRYFDRIIARANTRFMMMSGAQYELKRSAGGDNVSQSGLDLDVIDHYNGTERSVKTLSGGESFKASLSLALGLADEIRSSAGGVQLDSMFVDEGFGSLDEESRRQAVRALNELTAGNRLVGIISHVTELKESVEKQILVKRARSGGSVVSIQV